MVNLSDHQVNKLFDFVKSKYVRYYDLQLELVDHLASSIEEEIIQDPALSFEQGLKKVYDRWPITGFNNFINKKKKGLEKYWRRRFWNYLKMYFQLPKIILVVLLSMVFFFSAQVQFSLFGLPINLLYVALIVIGGIAYYQQHHPLGQYPAYGKTSLLTHHVFLEQIGFILLVPAILLYVLLQEPTAISQAIKDNTIIGISFSLLMAFTVIVLYAKNTIFVKWIEEEIQEKYPEFIMATK